MKTNLNVFRCISNEYHNHTEGKRKRQRNKEKGGGERGKDRGREGKRKKKIKMKVERKEPNNLRTCNLTIYLKSLVGVEAANKSWNVFSRFIFCSAMDKEIWNDFRHIIGLSERWNVLILWGGKVHSEEKRDDKYAM